MRQCPLVSMAGRRLCYSVSYSAHACYVLETGESGGWSLAICRCLRVVLSGTIEPVPIEIRDYERADEQDWLRCRVLSFLGTAYFDDVMTVKRSPAVGAELVAVDSGAVVGVFDLSIDGALATIDTIGVHPDYRHQGIGTRLFDLACARAASLGATTIEAWTRDDEATLCWYRARGMSESCHYLHVYADYYADTAEPAEAVQALPGLTPMKVFLHVMLDHEAEMRAKFRRVHVCRRFAMPLTGQPGPPSRLTTDCSARSQSPSPAVASGPLARPRLR